MIRDRTGRATMASAALLIASKLPMTQPFAKDAGRNPRVRRAAPGTHSAKTSVLQLLVNIRGKLVEAFVDGHLFSHHLLQRLRPQGRKVEEQRLGRKVDLCARRRDFVLLQIARIGLRDAVAS